MEKELEKYLDLQKLLCISPWCFRALQRSLCWLRATTTTSVHHDVFLFPRCLWWMVRWALLFVLRWARRPWLATLPESSSLIIWCSKSPISLRGLHASHMTHCKRWRMVFVGRKKKVGRKKSAKKRIRFWGYSQLDENRCLFDMKQLAELKLPSANACTWIPVKLLSKQDMFLIGELKRFW